jgi:hypothetical protein
VTGNRFSNTVLPRNTANTEYGTDLKESVLHQTEIASYKLHYRTCLRIVNTCSEIVNWKERGKERKKGTCKQLPIAIRGRGEDWAIRLTGRRKRV